MTNPDDNLPPPPPPQFGGDPGRSRYESPEADARARNALVVPGAVLAVISALGILVCGFFATVYAVMDPEEMRRELTARGQPMEFAELGQQIGMVMFGVSCLLNCISLAGAVAMMRARGWGLAMTGTIIALVNLCCCVAGIPVGIWCLVVLLRPETKAAFVRR